MDANIGGFTNSRCIIQIKKTTHYRLITRYLHEINKNSMYNELEQRTLLLQDLFQIAIFG